MNTGTTDSNTYTRGSYNTPSQSPWRNNTIDYVMSKNWVIGSGRMSMARVLLYDSGSSYNDK